MSSNRPRLLSQAPPRHLPAVKGAGPRAPGLYRRGPIGALRVRVEATLDEDGALWLPPQVLRGPGDSCAADKLGLHELPPTTSKRRERPWVAPGAPVYRAGWGKGSPPHGAALWAVQKPGGNIARLRLEAAPTSHRRSKHLSKKPRFKFWTLRAQGRHAQRGRLESPAPAGQKRGSRKTTKFRVSLA